MAPTVGTVTGNGLTSGATTLTVNTPVVVDGDLMLAFAISGTGLTREVTAPIGWTPFFNQYLGTAEGLTFNHHYKAWYRVASSEGATRYQAL